MSDKFFVGLDLTSAEDNGLQRPISRVTLLLDGENSITAGNDTGAELLADCPHATQTMANAILAQVRGYQYHMFRADDAALDPSAELGDGVTAGSVYSVISRISDDGSGYAGITAPGEAELEDEYPVSGPMTQAFDRKIATTRSQILKTAEQIRLEVSNELKGLSSSIDIRLDGITLRVQGAEGNISTLTQTADRLQSQITNTNGNVSTITQTVDSITTEISYMDRDISRIEQKVNNIRLEVSNGESSSWIDLTVDGVEVSSQKIQFTGDVVFASDLFDGTTTISGDCIRTGEISSDYIHLGGQLTVYQEANSSLFGGYLGYVNGVDADGFPTSGIGMAYGKYNGQVMCTNAGARLSYGSSSSVTCTSGRVSLRGDEIVVNGTLKSSDGTIITSDRNKKEDIREDPEKYLPLLNRLRPVSYRLKGRKRRHLGFVAQDVEGALKTCGMDPMDFAGLAVDESGEYGLRYEEFIPLLAEEVRRLKKRLEELSA